MKPVFKANCYDKISLFPEDILAQIDEDHPVRLVDKVVDALNIDSLIENYKGGGASSFHPRLMLKILFYGYLNNVYSCRKIEKALHENICFMWLAKGAQPDYRTINYFRGKRLHDDIQAIFAQIVTMLVAMGHISLEVQYIDGTKIEAFSGRYSVVWKKSVERHKGNLEKKIQGLLHQIDDQQKEENQVNNEAHKPIDNEELLKMVGKINKSLTSTIKKDKETTKKLKELKNKHLPKLKEYNSQLEKLGSRNSYSKTDEDATFMRTKDDHLQNGQLKPMYNVQVTTEEQFITHYTLHQTAGDTTTFIPHLESFEKQYDVQSNEVVADAGYGSEENYEFLENKNIEGYVKYNQFENEQKTHVKENPFLQQNLYYNQEKDFYVCPMGQHMDRAGEGVRESANKYKAKVVYYQAKNCSGCPMRGMCFKGEGNRKIEVNPRLNELRAQARDLLHSELGRAHRIKRNIEPEAVFGQLKSNNFFRRFTFKGLTKTNLEFGLQAIGHNFRKLVSVINQTGKHPFNPHEKGVFQWLSDFYSQSLVITYLLMQCVKIRETKC